jgi:hypothetical protein
MSQKLWVQHETPSKTFIDKVSIDGCEDIADFLKEVKKESQLSIPSKTPITLFQPDGTTEIKPTVTIQSLGNMGKDADAPLVVKTSAVGKSSRLIQAPTGSSKKQLTYKGLGVEASCRKYFDALARKLALYYRFKWTHGKYPTMGDVLYAYQKRAWKYQYEYQTEEERTDESGFTQVDEQVPILSIRLPDLFDTDEWAKLKEWNQKTNSRIHDADLPKTSTGKYFVIIPHADYNDKTISFFKTIGVKGHLYDNESKLEVKDEDDLSGSSSSESGSPDKEKKM